LGQDLFLSPQAIQRNARSGAVLSVDNINVQSLRRDVGKLLKELQRITTSELTQIYLHGHITSFITFSELCDIAFKGSLL